MVSTSALRRSCVLNPIVISLVVLEKSVKLNKISILDFKIKKLSQVVDINS